MDLTVHETAGILRLSEKTVVKLAKDRKIRGYKIYGQYRFNRDELNETILNRRIDVSDDVLSLIQSSIPVDLYELFSRGGIHYNVQGNTVAEVITSSVNEIKLPVDSDKKRIIASLLEREEQMTTGMGEGLALPHPRNPIFADISLESISICLLDHPIDFSAIDGKPVHTLFIILSANARRHLETLSRISHLCRSSDFYRLLAERAPEAEIFSFIDSYVLSGRK